MTENEIVQYLKENKNKGVMYIFMPEEVKDWCFYKKEYRSDFLLYKPDRGGWVSVSDDFVMAAGYVIALPEDFKLREKPEGGWVECEINNKNECFFINGHYYHWSEWNTCLIHNNDWLKAFGGWQYESDGGWFMSPCIKTPKNTLWTYNDSESESLPAIPIKIRFWREKK